MKKVLNLYAGIGGNRKLWTDVDVTAIELNPDIAKIYQDFFPDDKVIVADAHQYLLEHYKEYDFIWSSPPCPTHSRARFWGSHREDTVEVYPDMTLYQEIIFLIHYCKSKWVIENVIPYYKPLIPATGLGRHLYWSNFVIYKITASKSKYYRHRENGELKKILGFDLDEYRIKDKNKLLRNCVLPELGLHIFKSMNNQELKLAI